MTMADDQNAVQLDNVLVKQLLTSVQTLQLDMAALKSGATGGSNLIQPFLGAVTLSQTDSVVSGSDTDLLLSNRDLMKEETPRKNLLPVMRMTTMSSRCQRPVMRSWKQPLS